MSVIFIKVIYNIKTHSVAALLYFWSGNTDRHHSQDLTQSRKTSLMSITSGKTPHCSSEIKDTTHNGLEKDRKGEEKLNGRSSGRE